MWARNPLTYCSIGIIHNLSCARYPDSPLPIAVKPPFLYAEPVTQLWAFNCTVFGKKRASYTGNFGRYTARMTGHIFYFHKILSFHLSIMLSVYGQTLLTMSGFR